MKRLCIYYRMCSLTTECVLLLYYQVVKRCRDLVYTFTCQTQTNIITIIQNLRVRVQIYQACAYTHRYKCRFCEIYSINGCILYKRMYAL